MHMDKYVCLYMYTYKNIYTNIHTHIYTSNLIKNTANAFKNPAITGSYYKCIII
jgi:hypothetical protein